MGFLFWVLGSFGLGTADWVFGFKGFSLCKREGAIIMVI